MYFSPDIHYVTENPTILAILFCIGEEECDFLEITVTPNTVCV